MRSMGFMIIALMMTAGCAHLREAPVAPSIDSSLPAVRSSATDSPFRLWGEWTFYIPATHDRVDVVPRRQARLHLNALKFLEDYCNDCLQITKIKNNGDGTIDLTVKLAHPFKGFPQYTAFDVRGIIMFNGTFAWNQYPDVYEELPVPDPCLISWREMGDPEVLNPDGYEYRWSPVYESGSDMPIYNYWPGKYSKGLPNAGLNAYLNFYSVPERHVFFTDSQVQRTYKIWLPPGEPVVAGYAVEACWEPPTVMPVKNPLTDFPLSANTSEPYFYDVIINNGEPVVENSGCCGFEEGAECDTLRIVDKEWDGDHNTHITWWDPEFTYWGGTVGIAWSPCGDEYPDSYWTSSPMAARPVGNHRAIVRYFRGTLQGGHFDQVFDFADYTVVPE